MRKIYVGNILFNAAEQDIRNLFSEHGEVESVKIITDKFTGHPRGFGFIEMETEKDTQKAISALNGKPFMGKPLTVSEARSRQPRYSFQERRGGFGGGMGRRGWR